MSIIIISSSIIIISLESGQRVARTESWRLCSLPMCDSMEKEIAPFGKKIEWLLELIYTYVAYWKTALLILIKDLINRTHTYDTLKKETIQLHFLLRK